MTEASPDECPERGVGDRDRWWVEDASDLGAAAAAVEPLVQEYWSWAGEELAGMLGRPVRTDSADRMHRAFMAELPTITGPRGRLLVARNPEGFVGVAMLKPVDDVTAELKRVYVRPVVRGRGVARALLRELLDAARAEGFVTVRLESLRFMTAAHALYRSEGFVEMPPFAGSEAGSAGLESAAVFMEIRL
ncbi:GNAT family N-acetyltransferase [Rhodococcus sp. ACS1]|uniref:GNAT family N-acetyltransferase n=1 Tax=Rhodococcus sp. ACS1 TaxID=2028570 RepID=UPI000BB12065|nr:GNAT family N-acetyltransferase [Rhodococcus sp. ACS1]PBC35707.1 GNAT family N-acetyltransferase [Rhodococcus sp. ACS1]